MKVFYLTLLILAIFRICGHSEYEDSKPYNKVELTLDDQYVLDAVYSGNKSKVEGFYFENMENVFLRYETFSNIDSSTYLPSHTHLCTQNKNIAFKWSELSNKKFPFKTDIVDENENHRFFQFIRKNEVTGHVFLSRVHNCNYLKQLNYKRDSLIAYTTVNYIEPDSFKKICEYIWFIHNYNIEGSVVLQTFFLENKFNQYYVIFESETVFGDWNLCDQINVYKTVFKLENKNGKISKIREKEKTLRGMCN